MLNELIAPTFAHVSHTRSSTKQNS